MSKKNALSIIVDKKSRTDRWQYAALGEIATLHSGFMSLSDPDPYQISLHVVGIVSCIEAFSRSCIKILIDGDEATYLERAKHFKDLTFDFDLTKALSRKEITFGDLVSHSISVSSAEHIIKHFDTLFTGDIGYKNFKLSLGSVKEFIEPTEDEILGPPGEYRIQYGELIVDDADQLIKDIQDLFTARHIAAHEANFRLVTLDQLNRWFESSMLFANATYEIIEQKLRPGAPRCAFGSSIQALIDSGKLYSVIDDLMKELMTKWAEERMYEESEAEGLRLAIKASEDAFQNYLEKETAVHYARVAIGNGNIYRNLDAMVQRKLLERKIEYLKQLLED